MPQHTARSHSCCGSRGAGSTGERWSRGRGRWYKVSDTSCGYKGYKVSDTGTRCLTPRANTSWCRSAGADPLRSATSCRSLCAQATFTGLDSIFTPEELAQVHAYVRPYYVWSAVRDVVSLGVFVLILRYGVQPMHRLAARSSEWLAARLSWARRALVIRALPAAFDRLWGGSGWGTALLFSLLYLLLLEAIYLPRDVYFRYFHEHAFGLSNYTPGRFARDELKSLGLQVFATSALAFGLYGLARRLRLWWLILGIVAGGVLLFSAVLDPYRSRIFFAQTPLPDGPLRDRITALMTHANIEFSDVVVDNTSRATKTVSAYFAGQGPTRKIVLSDTLVQHLHPDEIAAVIAHEAGHVHESRWPRRILSSLALLGFLFGVDRLLRLAARRRWFGTTEFADIRTLPTIGVALWFSLTLGQPFSAADSRAREREADTYALNLTRDPESFRRMLVKATRLNKFDPDPPKWIELRGYGHPSIKDRLAHVAAFEKKTGGE